MARPWKKRRRWPHIARSGAKSYAVGYYDHERKERTKAFPSARSAEEWMRGYVDAERRGVESLRRFLLDLDAREANAALDVRTAGEIIQLYFAHNSPELEEGLATSTFKGYMWTAKRHLLGDAGALRGKPLKPADYAVRFAAEPATRLNEPDGVRWLREAMKLAGVGPSARSHTWAALSAVLSWAADSDLVAEIQTNGCLAANEKRSSRRKSQRRKTGRTGRRRHGQEIQSWALAPFAVELIRALMIQRASKHRPLLAYRDATVMSLQFGLGLRPQEVYGARWFPLGLGEAYIEEVTSWDGLVHAGKTEGSTGRKAYVPELVEEDLSWWRERLVEHGRSPCEHDFIIPGDIAGSRWGVREKVTGACHMSPNQAKKWGPRQLTPVIETLADNDQAYAGLRGATPYSLRRGGISMRLRHEDAQSVADQCGTSLAMLSQHYSYEIDEFARAGARSVDESWRAARLRVQADLGSR